MPGMFGGRSRKRKLKVPEALEQLTQEEEQKLIDMDSVARTAVERVEQAGIIFVDEIDKIAGREGGQGPDVSREGVQRDILPIVEGTTVNTKYGMVRTDHILFIAAGAFHVSKPSDLIPELQGRFPIRVELEALGRDDFVRILTEPQNALVKQYIALLDTEGITLTFTDDAIERIATLAMEVNEQTENIGARRLHTVMEKLLDEISFEGPDLVDKSVTIDDAYVRACWTTSSGTKICPATSCDRLVLLPVIAACTRSRGRAHPRRARVRGAAATGRVRQEGPAARAPRQVARRPGAGLGLARRRYRDHRLHRPGANVSGVRPADIDRVDVYAWTGPDVPAARVFKVAKVVASVPVRPPPPPQRGRRGRARAAATAAGRARGRSGRGDGAARDACGRRVRARSTCPIPRKKTRTRSRTEGHAAGRRCRCRLRSRGATSSSA